jgi:hypothetical protein
VSTGVTITSQPQGQAGAVGSTATFSVDVSGPAFFQWNKDGSAIPGATSRSYTTPPLVLEDSGSKYSVTATPVSGAPVTVTSADANLTVVGTRLYTEGVIEYVSWLGNSVTTIDAGKTALGNPIGSYAAGGGTNPSLRMAVDAFDSRVAYPDNSHDNYTGAMFGYFIPDQNGTYYFHLKSDDNGQLFFNPNGSALPDLVTDSDGDGNPDSLVAWETGCCNDFQPAGNMRTGGPFILTANQKYGILGIYHEGGGNDYLQVAVTRDGVVTGLDKTDLTDLRNRSTIPSKYLAAVTGLYAPDLAIANHPQSLFIEDKRLGTFSVTTSAAPGISYQWQSAPAGSSTFIDIAGGTSTSLTVKAIFGASGNNGTQYRVKLHAQDQDLISDIAVLSVHPDETPPRVANAATSPNLNAITITFDEPVTLAGAIFSLSGGTSVTNSEQITDTTIVVHLGTALSPNTSSVLTASGVKDLSGNVIAAPNNTITFTSAALPSFPSPPQIKIPGYTTFERYDEAVLSTVQDRIDNGPPPEVYTLLNHFEQQVNQADTYCSVKYGWFVPPTTGSYVFFIATMFSGRLYLSTDADPSHKKLIASEPNYSLNREWTSSLGNSSLGAKRSDKFPSTEWPGGNTIVLLAGQPYYIEERQDGGGGGDDGAATFKSANEPDPLNGSESRITGSTIFTYVDLSRLAPIITNRPVGRHFEKGENVTLSVGVIGTNLTYQWYRTQRPIPGAISNSYTIPNADATACGTYAVIVSNSVGTADTLVSDVAARLIMNGATLNIEAEDFNYGGGKTLAIASEAPYTGNAYKGLKGIPDIDYMDDGDNSGSTEFPYNRFEWGDPAVVEIDLYGRDYDRGSWSVSTNYAIYNGWKSHWQNYTRTLPDGHYIIFAGATPEPNMVLSKVTNPTIPDGSTPDKQGGLQGLTTLGSFVVTSLTGTLGDLNELVPLTDDDGNLVQVELGGVVTLRLTFVAVQTSDFLLLYCTDCPDPNAPRLEVNRNGNQFTLTWTNAGTLEYTDALIGAGAVWTSTGDSDGSFTELPNQAHRFYRVTK